MPDDKDPVDLPIAFADVLQGELQALRPELDVTELGAISDTDVFTQIHQLERPLSALCISGGGIRSATFSLGAIQALAELGMLQQFDYLSTVSGGGYIGGWLTAWKHRAGGLDKILPALRSEAKAEPLPTGSDPVHHLREYNNYLSPKLGAFSADAWTLFATVSRNILLNWTVLIPVILLFLLLPRYVVGVFAFPELLHGKEIFKDGIPNYGAKVLDDISSSPWVDLGLPILSAFCFAMALFNILRYLPSVGNRDHSRGDYRAYVLTPLILAVFTFLMFDSLYYLGSRFVYSSNLGPVLLWAVVPACAAWAAYLLCCVRSWRQGLRLLFGPLSLAIAAMASGTGIAAWISTNFLLWSPNPAADTSWAEYVSFGPSLVLLGYCFGVTLFLGLSSSFLKDDDREWMSRAMAGVFLFAAAWTSVCVLVLVVPRWVLVWHPAIQGSAGLLGGLAGWFSAQSEDDDSSQLTHKLRELALKATPALFVGALMVALSILTNFLLVGLHILLHQRFGGPAGGALDLHSHHDALTRVQPLVVILLTLLLAITCWVTARFINVNTFSLNGLYRDRLVRAYLGASNPQRKASRFTGFAADDDLPMASLDPGEKPFHVLNLTLNLVASRRLDWQQRKADSFTVTPLTCGNSDLGYRPSKEYGGERGITLGTAVSISGAAASPNMGSNTSSVMAFILTLFNARLGAWLGNPGLAGEKTWRHEGPKQSVQPLFSEAFAQTTDESDYVYLSDGGHFDNLGVYEMVRRRCRTIVVFDSGADPLFTYDDLGNALRKIRIDMKIPIEFKESLIRPLQEGKRRCAVARIVYSAVDGDCEDGRLIYIKPLLLGQEPPDVLSYSKANPTFPHQTTSDQFFDESQTESYRTLGRHSVLEVCHGAKSGLLANLATELESNYLAGC